MPVLKNAAKALRRDKRRTQVNKVIRSQVRTILQKAETDQSKTTISQVFSIVDRAAKKGILHKNKAARIKAKVSSLGAATNPTTTPPKTKTKSPSKSKARKSTAKNTSRSKTK